MKSTVLIAAACLSVLLTSFPALADEDAVCRQQGIEKGNDAERLAPEEPAAIAVSDGRVSRTLGTLHITLGNGRALDLVDVELDPEDTCYTDAQSTFRFEGIASGYAIVRNVQWEYYPTLLIDLATGDSYEIPAGAALASSDGRYLFFQTDYFASTSVSVEIFDVSGPLKSALIKEVQVDTDGIWTDTRSLQLLTQREQSNRYQEPIPYEVIVQVGETGIEATIPALGESDSAEFLPTPRKPKWD